MGEQLLAAAKNGRTDDMLQLVDQVANINFENLLCPEFWSYVRLCGELRICISAHCYDLVRKLYRVTFFMSRSIVSCTHILGCGEMIRIIHANRSANTMAERL
jgi:hypothetical protein